MRATRRAAAVLLTVAALILLGGSAALAAQPSPSPSPSRVIVYIGMGITSNPAHPEYARGAVSLPTTATVDCTSDPCTIRAVVTDTTSGDVVYDLTDGQRIPLVGGRVSTHIAGHADAACVDGEVPPGEFGAVATGDTLTVTFAFAATGSAACSDGSSASSIGGYVYTATVTAPAGTTCLVTGTCPTPTPSPRATSTVAPAAASGPLRAVPPAVRIDDPSSLSTLPTAATAVTPANILWAVAATVVLVLLIAFPSHLLNAATEAGTDRVSEWWKLTRARARARVRATTLQEAYAPAARAPAAAKPIDLAGWPLAAVGVLLASLISSFVDPGFGFNAASIRVFLSILLSFLVDAVLGWFLLILLVRRTNPHATAAFRFAPASLLVVVVAVLFTRFTGFAPGIIFGLVAGVVFGAIVATAEKARLALISLGYSFVLAIVGWAGYSILAATAGAHPAAPVVFVQETLSSIAIGGIAALPIVLVPVRGMAGFEIWSWNRVVWAAAYVVGLLGFFVVLMPKPFSWATVGLSIWAWGGIYVAYAATALVLWLVITRPWRREPGAADGTPEKPEAVHSPDVVPES